VPYRDNYNITSGKRTTLVQELRPVECECDKNVDRNPCYKQTVVL